MARAPVAKKTAASKTSSIRSKAVAAPAPKPKAAAESAFSMPAGMDLKNIGKMLRDLKLPGLDIKEIVESQRKDIEALAEVSRHARESMESLATRQGEMLKEAMATFQSNVTEGDKSAAGRAEQAKDALGTAVSNMRELAEMTVQAHQQAFTIIKERMAERLAKITGKAG